MEIKFESGILNSPAGRIQGDYHNSAQVSRPFVHAASELVFELSKRLGLSKFLNAFDNVVSHFNVMRSARSGSF